MGIAPLLVISASAEVVGVAAVIPFLSLLAAPDSLAAVPFIGEFIAAQDIGDSLAALRWVGLALAGMILLTNLLVIATNWWLHRFTWGLNHSLSSRLMRHYLAQPYVFMLTRNTASLVNKVIAEVRQLITDGFRAALEVVTRSVIIVALVAFLVVLDPVMAGVAFLVFSVAYGSIFWLSRAYLRRIGREAVAAGAARLKAANEALGGFKDIKVAGRETSALARYEGPSKRFSEVQGSVMIISNLPRYALEAVSVGGMVLVATLLAGREGSFGELLPLLGAYAFAGLRLMPAMQSLFNAAARLRFTRASLAAVEADLREVRDEEDDALASLPDPMPLSEVIALRSIGFRYPAADGPALQGVDLTIAKRSSLAIVGRTGSGKSTLVDILLGLLTPDRGDILVDGKPVGAGELRAYRRLFGYVPQSIYLLDDTISRNVALGLADDEIDHAAVRRACELAQIASFIEEELPQGYETVVGERGIRLSGGQRQRIGIARALYHGPEVLVFDEATSALDVHTERQVYEALEGIARSHTVVTIAHRLDTVAAADHVVVLERGRVVSEGAPKDVLATYRAGAPSG